MEEASKEERERERERTLGLMPLIDGTRRPHRSEAFADSLERNQFVSEEVYRRGYSRCPAGIMGNEVP